jgi:hypothetical protein
MIKMLNRGGSSLGAVARHLEYLDRGGELEIERDDGEPLQGKGAAKALIDDWDLDLDQKRPTAKLRLPAGRNPAKLVHKMIISMPAGTPPQKVLAAVKNFAREEFALKHRYAMVLHTDQSHPHVHMVVKAIGKDGRRLNVRHATLREWRREFTRHLREQGVEANATERAIRGVTAPQKVDGMGEAIAQASGAQIATGLREQLDGFSNAVQRITQRLRWLSMLKWIAGIAIGIALTIGLGVWAMLPRVDGVPWSYVWAGAARLRSCDVGKEVHVCIAIDDKPRLVKDVDGQLVVVVRGM